MKNSVIFGFLVGLLVWFFTKNYLFFMVVETVGMGLRWMIEDFTSLDAIQLAGSVLLFSFFHAFYSHYRGIKKFRFEHGKRVSDLS